MNIEWKPVGKNYSKYLVSNTGKIKNIETGYIFNNLSCIGGYVRCRLIKDDGKTHNTLVHRIVALAFLPNLEEKSFVDHINKDRSDNRVENLRWVTKEENAKNQTFKSCKSRKIHQMTTEYEIIKTYNKISEAPFNSGNIISVCSGKKQSAYGFRWKYADEVIEGEEFREIAFNNIKLYVSNFGRIKMPSGKITYGGYSSSGYRNVNVKKKIIFVHTLVALCFIGKKMEGMVIHHKDNNKENNNVNNLEYISQRDNVFHAAKNNRKKPEGFERKVKSISINGNVTFYKNIHEAGKETKTSIGNICSCCKGTRKTAGGLKWSYENDSLHMLTEEQVKKVEERVCKGEEDGL